MKVITQIQVREVIPSKTKAKTLIQMNEIVLNNGLEIIEDIYM